MPEIRNARRPVSEGSQDGFDPVISPVAMALGLAVEDAAWSGKCGRTHSIRSMNRRHQREAVNPRMNSSTRVEA
ncbi:hypothetical protein, partial [Pseudomonas aeruginosa]|uniref:hypothetical protein n=1 Tax=Pseudomonas aeruginosa TaxID=287 RepID=UPI002E8E6CAC|nr:hypothetical protein [Pseudomonas aeruginosa]